MKSVLSIVLASAVLVTVGRAQDTNTTQNTNTTQKVEQKIEPLDKDKVSYAVGMFFGNTLKRQATDVDVDTVTQAIKDILSGAETRLTEQEAQQTIQAMQTQVRAKREEEMRVQGDKNKKEGQTFLTENAGKTGVVVATNGLQYKIITAGTGEKPKLTDTVSTQYRGRLIDGTEFDSSYKRNQPAEFPVNGVVPGWTQALQMMPVGSKWELYVPSELAYGERGSGPNIGPNSTLIFEIELLAIKPKADETNQAVSGEIIKVPSAEELKKGAKIEVIRPDSTNTLTPKK